MNLLYTDAKKTLSIYESNNNVYLICDMLCSMANKISFEQLGGTSEIDGDKIKWTFPKEFRVSALLSRLTGINVMDLYQKTRLPSPKKQGPKLIHSDNVCEVYDYTEKSIVVKIAANRFREYEDVLTNDCSGKKGKYTFADGVQGYGWVFAKSNTKSMSVLNDVFGIKIEELTALPVQKNYQRHSFAPQMTDGPFQHNILTMLSPHERIAKALTEFTKAIGMDPGVYIIGHHDDVVKYQEDQVPEFEGTYNGFKCVKLKQGE